MNELLIVNSKFYYCSSTFADIHFTMLLAKNF